jgi:hypothetical protein
MDPDPHQNKKRYRTDRIPQHYMLCTAYIQKKVFVKLEFITKVFFKSSGAIVSVIMYGTLL